MREQNVEISITRHDDGSFCIRAADAGNPKDVLATREIEAEDTLDMARMVTFMGLMKVPPFREVEPEEEKALHDTVLHALAALSDDALTSSKALMDNIAASGEGYLGTEITTAFGTHDDALLIIAAFFLTTKTNTKTGSNILSALFIKWMSQESDAIEDSDKTKPPSKPEIKLVLPGDPDVII